MKKDYSSVLSIGIPTYNRYKDLDINLKMLSYLIEEFNITIHISNNYSTDQTEMVVMKYLRKYPQNIKYYKANKPSEHGDRNFYFLLKKINTKYKWLICDNTFYNYHEMETLLKILENKDYDVIVTEGNNEENNKRALKNKCVIYKDAKSLFKNHMWNMTKISSTIYKKNVIDETCIKEYLNTHFIHIAFTAKYLASHRCEALYYPKLCFTVGKKHSSQVYDARKGYEIVAYDWPKFVMSLPKYYEYSLKRKIIKSHTKIENPYPLYRLVIVRQNNGFDIKSCMKNIKNLYYGEGLIRTVLVIAIAVLPIKNKNVDIP